MNSSHRRTAIRLVAVVLVGASSALGCASKEAAEETADAQTQRTRDSAIGASGLPGARGVQGALEVADSAAARQARIDSLSQDP